MHRLVAFLRRPFWDPANPAWVVRRWPDLVGVVTATLFFWISLTPSLLPRPWVMQALIGGITAAAGYAVGSVTSTVFRLVTRWRPSDARRAQAWQAFYVVAFLASTGAVVWSARSQRTLRMLQGLGPSAPWNGAMIMAIALGTFLTLLTVCRAVRLLARKLVAWFERLVPRPWSYVFGLYFCTALIVVGTQDLLWNRGFIGLMDRFSEQVNAGTEPGIRPPTSPSVSGSPASLVPWDSLGTKGRTFVAEAPTREAIAAFGQPGSAGGPMPPREGVLDPIRVYVGEQPGEPDFTKAADLAVRELDRTGAWNRKVLAILGTTGSGWVDENIPTPLEYMYGGDTAMVALQYSYLPSWISFVVDAERAGHASRALYKAVHSRWAALPPDHRPKLVLGGESLGVLGTDMAFSGPQALIDASDGAFFEGPPYASRIWRTMATQRDAGSPIWRPVYQGGRSVRFFQYPGTDLDWPAGPWQHPKIVYAQNASDPVVWWTPGLLFSKPRWLEAPLGPDVSSEVRYYPFITFWQTTVDLAVSFGSPWPHGHTYATDPVDGWAAVLPPPGWTDADTERLENTMAALKRDTQ
jgi:uncharacterized membrane protein